MDSISIKSNAKINLSIDVLKRFSNGYHEVDMIMQEIDLYDNLFIERRNDDKIKISSNSKIIPIDENNIAYKACEYMMKNFYLESGYNVYIDKKIPVEAGLAGGSTNAAAVIKAIAELENINLNFSNSSGSNDDSVLKNADAFSRTKIAQRIGCDVSFFLEGKTARATGLGESIENIKSNMNYYIVIVKPSFSIPTKWVYENLDIKKIIKRPDNLKVIEALRKADMKMLSENSVNVLETVLNEKYPEISIIKTKFLEMNASITMMCGSGSSVLGIFEEEKLANSCYQNMKKEYDVVFLSKPVF